MASKKTYVDLDLAGNQIINFAAHKAATAPTSPFEGQIYYNTVSKKFFGFDGVAWIDLSQTISSGVTLKGEINNASTNPAYPASPSQGDMYFITTTAGTVGGQVVEIGDTLVYSGSAWFILQKNVEQSSETKAGYIQIATQAETNAGSNDAKAVTPAKLVSFLSTSKYVRKNSQVVSLTANTPLTVTHGLSLTAAAEVQVQCFQGGAIIELLIEPTTVNAVNVTSNVTLANVTVVCQG